MGNQEIEAAHTVFLKNFLIWGTEKCSVARIGLEVKEGFLNLGDVTFLYANRNNISQQPKRMV